MILLLTCSLFQFHYYQLWTFRLSFYEKYTNAKLWILFPHTNFSSLFRFLPCYSLSVFFSTIKLEHSSSSSSNSSSFFSVFVLLCLQLGVLCWWWKFVGCKWNFDSNSHFCWASIVYVNMYHYDRTLVCLTTVYTISRQI